MRVHQLASRATNNIMIDLETLGSRPTSQIVSIGACTFDRKGIDAMFYRSLRNDGHQMMLGLTMDDDTIRWWERQSSEALSVFADKDAVTLQAALRELRAWVKGTNATIVWSHGSSFDMPIIDNAYRAIMEVPPWHFWNYRDTRTIYDVANVQPDRRVGVHHNALDDAVAQALAVIRAKELLDGQRFALNNTPEGAPGAPSLAAPEYLASIRRANRSAGDLEKEIAF